MPQLSLYFDDGTLKMVEKAAKLSNTSISKWVRSKVIQSLENEWPDGYFDLFGSIGDTSFDAPAEPDRINAAPREEL